MRSFYCLLAEGGNLDDSIRTLLYLTAVEMLETGKSQLRFTDELAEGRITSDGKVVIIQSAVRGVSFNAVVDCKKGNSIKCRFLVDPDNLIPEEEFYEGISRWTHRQITFSE